MSLVSRKRSPASSSSVVQTGSTVSGNQIGGNYNQTNIHLGAQRAASVVEQLLARLQEEVEKESHCSEMLDRLKRYHGGIVKDGIQGLEAKLEKAGRAGEIEYALERKESFSKLLEMWSLYASAQEIFAYLLARTEHLFNSEILPEIGDLSIVQINQKINKSIINPTVEECGASLFKIDHFVAMGMVYWLAEQCFVRWH